MREAKQRQFFFFLSFCFFGAEINSQIFQSVFDYSLHCYGLNRGMQDVGLRQSIGTINECSLIQLFMCCQALRLNNIFAFQLGNVMFVKVFCLVLNCLKVYFMALNPLLWVIQIRCRCWKRKTILIHDPEMKSRVRWLTFTKGILYLIYKKIPSKYYSISCINK